MIIPHLAEEPLFWAHWAHIIERAQEQSLKQGVPLDEATCEWWAETFIETFGDAVDAALDALAEASAVEGER